MFERRRPGNAQADADFAPTARRGQRPVDYFAGTINFLKQRPFTTNSYAFHVPPHEYYCKDLVPPYVTPFNSSTALCTQWVHTTAFPDNRAQGPGPNRRRVFFTTMEWSPSGRRLLCAASNGDFVILNGHAFGVEHKTPAHEDGKACKALAWGSLTDAILSGDDCSSVKLWGSNFTLAAEIDCNQRAVKDIEWAPGEQKFATAGQDGSVRIWDARRVASGGGSSEFETRLEGHGGDVTSVAWHRDKALLATASQDRCLRLWDPRAGVNNQLAVLQGHTDSASSVTWHPSGHEWLLLSCGRDSTIRLWDARTMKELCKFLGHTGDVTEVQWHPTHPPLFSSAGADGTIAYWSIAQGETEVTKWSAAIDNAHDAIHNKANPVSCIRWSPLGHLMASCSAEVNFWARNKPGAVEEIRFKSDETEDVVMPAAEGGVAGW